ncbi:STAS/SEC14 domain-containing protein [Stigmatella sp. ncwal1]|uniref:STAS/SEC14 domain-containing protein n=1 Tax=Stigmatella ashevillensis TaxID=2995309 RepID=A0ABT5DFV8_9BACT|nr:STAS/SEC14 domain-containing protein [Stigmatella ashevillena]MDC0712556.1 STAS/SEC14 domain-containing protein [Stigmatella ashevillena]
MEMSFGPHKLTLMEPDIVRIAINGQMGLKEVRETVFVAEEFKRGKGRIYLIVDASHGAGYSLEARRAIGEEPRLSPYTSVVIIGASTTMRTITALMIRALALLGRMPQGSMVFKDTEEEALAWIAEVRQRHAQES